MLLMLGCNGCTISDMNFSAVTLPVTGGSTKAQNAIWVDASDTLSATVVYNLSAIARSGNVVTATTATAHSVVSANIVKVAGSTGGATSFNGTFQVLYANDSTHISWIQTGPNESGTVSTGTVSNYKSSPSNNVIFRDLDIYSPTPYRPH